MAAAKAKKTHKGTHVASLSPTRVSEVTIDAPEAPYKVVLRSELEHLSPVSDTSYFQVTDWIYTQEKESLLHEPPPQVSQSIDLKSSKKEEWAKVGRVRPPYLVDKEVTDPLHRQKLREAICMDRNAFYYYKERHLFKPRDIQLRSKLKLPSLSKKASQPIPESPSQEVHFSPEMKFLSKASPLPHALPSPRSRRKASLFTQELPKGNFLKTIIEKCDRVKPTDIELNQTARERELHRKVQKRLEWTKKTLDEIDDCEADILIPYYKHQKEALEDFQRDAHRLTEEFRHSSVDSSKSTLKMEKVLRKNRGMVL